MKTRLLFTLLAGNALMAQTFTEVPNTPFEGVVDGSPAFADVDGDNEPDVLITGRTMSGDPISKLYLNTDGTYVEVPNTPFNPVDNSAIAFADVDGDNDPDVLITGMSDAGPVSKLYINDSGTFTESTVNQFIAVSHGMVAFADIDGDADMDLFITGKGGDSTLVSNLYINDNGIFTATQTVIISSYDGSVNFVDIDGDSDPDFIISGSSISGGFKMYKNNGGIFVSDTYQFFVSMSNSSLAVADIDGDNDIDMVVSGEKENGTNDDSPPESPLFLFRNVENHYEWNNILNGVYAGSLTFSDVDLDGDSDLFVSGLNHPMEFSTLDYHPEFILYLNDGNGNFSELENTPFPGIGHGSVAIADIDNDGDPDVLIAGNTALQNEEGQYITKLYLNNSLPTNVPEKEASLSDFTIFPNPTAGQVHFSVNADVKVADVTGRIIATGKNINAFDFSEQPSGIYFITLTDPSGHLMQRSKIVKE